MNGPTQTARRPIRSYVLREGRMTEGQNKAFERLWPRYGLECGPDRQIDPARVFGNDRPLCLEIGFGNGDALFGAAMARPERNYLGIEVHRPGVGHLLLQLERNGLDNVRVLRQDATEVISRCLPDACLQGVFLFFPDPWPKKKHHKRRIVQPAFLTELARVIRPGGFVHMATDWENYAQHMLSLLEARADFVNTAATDGFVPRPEDRALTRFEQRGRRLGHGVWDLVFIRR